MNNFAFRIYQRLPGPVRSMVASGYGLRLRSWRYGPETNELVEEALSREQWNSDKWDEWQKERLSLVLHRAATKVPYYRSQWEVRRRKGDRSSWEYLENWPILDKQSLRENPRAFVANDCNISGMYCDYTSGSTGTPLTLWYSRKTLRAWNALFEARARRWHGVSRHENWATLGGKQVVPARVIRPPFWVWNSPMKQLYLSANHVSRNNVEAYMNALERYSITYMVVYPSSAAILAAEALALGVKIPKLSLIITVAEPLTPQRRQLLNTAFRCEVRETYGMAEIVAEATECKAEKLHLWPEVGRVEVLDDSDNVPVQTGTSGRLICTALLNIDMPLIRYAVGDRARQAGGKVFCSCGRTLPLLSSIEGRTSELLATPDGRRIYISISPIVNDLPIREAQVIQESLERLRIRYVPGQGFRKEMEGVIVERLKERIGTIEVIPEAMHEIPRGRNGKFRAVICNLPAEQLITLANRQSIQTTH